MGGSPGPPLAQLAETSRPVGSVTTTPSAVSVLAMARPPAPVDSSSVTVLTVRSPASSIPSFASVSAAKVIAATPPFMSHAPRPCTCPSATTPAKGGCRQPSSGSGETTSTWPLRMSPRPTPAPGKRAASCGRPSNVNPAGTIGWPAIAAGLRVEADQRLEEPDELSLTAGDLRAHPLLEV